MEINETVMTEETEHGTAPTADTDISAQAEPSAPESEGTSDPSEDGGGEEVPVEPSDSGDDVLPLPEDTSDADTMREVLECLRGLEQDRRDEQTAFLRERALEAIGKMDPSVRSMEDLFTMEGSDRFYDLVVHHGVDWENAFRAVKFDALMKNAEERGAQTERNRILSRSHLEKTKGRGTMQDHVPTEIMAIYRAMNPTASEAEIIRHYNQTKN